jgi:hypothetical protein
MSCRTGSFVLTVNLTREAFHDDYGRSLKSGSPKLAFRNPGAIGDLRSGTVP